MGSVKKFRNDFLLLLLLEVVLVVAVVEVVQASVKVRVPYKGGISFAGPMREVGISRPYDEEDDRKSFHNDHNWTEVPDAGFSYSDAFEEEKYLHFTEEQTVSATDAWNATAALIS